MIYDHMNEEHLYDDLPHNAADRTDSGLAELSQGRDEKHLGRIHANVYYTFLTAGTLLIAYGIYQLYLILVASI